jgi:catechol 2,3-dioxygenase-like lactoylglutathione lyase family enzyme
MQPIGLVPELYVRDINQTRAFYVELLGFEVLHERPEDKFIYTQRGNARMMFEELGASREWITGDLEYPYGRGINFQIEVGSVDELFESVLAEGVRPFLPLEDKWYRKDDIYIGNRQFMIQDPDGYLLRFFQDLRSRTQVA